MTEEDLRIFSHDHLLRQLQHAEFRNGYYVLEFYAENGKPASRITDTLREFFLYPSGGTLRDGEYNLLFYDSRYDTYRGFVPPHLTRH